VRTAANELNLRSGPSSPARFSLPGPQSSTPPTGECCGDEADVSAHPRVASAKTNLSRSARAGRTLQPHIERMAGRFYRSALQRVFFHFSTIESIWATSAFTRIELFLGQGGRLAYLLYSGLGIATDKERAIKLWRLAAYAGQSEAQWHLGVALEQGAGVERIARRLTGGIGVHWKRQQKGTWRRDRSGHSEGCASLVGCPGSKARSNTLVLRGCTPGVYLYSGTVTAPEDTCLTNVSLMCRRLSGCS
jgi:hypothetical protein